MVLVVAKTLVMVLVVVAFGYGSFGYCLLWLVY